MEVAALCSSLALTLFLLLAAHRVDADFRIIPTRLQVFEYESVSFRCKGLTGWRVSRKVRTDTSTCGVSKWGFASESSCTITGAYTEDSGEYWCEAAGGRRGNGVNITVTAVSVILESPVLPVMEGDDVTLRCRNKTSTNLSASFYKDGRLFRSSSTRETTIRRVNKADEGMYSCSIDSVGESPESRLEVRETLPSSDHMFLILRTLLPLVMMAPLFLLLGILHFGKIGESRGRCMTTACRQEETQKSDEGPEAEV